METVEHINELPSVGGAYALVIDLPRDTILPIRRLNNPPLIAGRYVYAGSANGPGGLRARLSRHLKAEKSIRWHIDYLTGIAGVCELAALPGATECDIVRVLSAIKGADFPCPGFGSSDCKTCRSHFLAVPEAVGAKKVLKLLKAKGVFWRRPPD